MKTDEKILAKLGEIAGRAYQIEGCGDHYKVDFKVGPLAERCCEDAVEMATALGVPVVFNFNGIECRATADSEPKEIYDHYHASLEAKHQAYENSPEGKAAAARRGRETAEAQARVDEMQASLPSVVNDQDALVEWLGEFGPLSDDIAIKIDSNGIISALEGAGYRPNDCVVDEEVKTDRGKCARWIVGQAIDGLSGGVGCIHPIARKFAEDYKKVRVA